MIIGYTVPEIWYMTHVIFIFHFGPFFALLPRNSPKNQNFKKMKKKKRLEILSCYTCVPIIMIGWCTVPEIWCATDRRTDGSTDRKNDIYRWLPKRTMEVLGWNPHELYKKSVQNQIVCLQFLLKMSGQKGRT